MNQRAFLPSFAALIPAAAASDLASVMAKCNLARVPRATASFGERLTRSLYIPYRLVSAFLYASASLAVRGCWHAVFGSQFLLLAPYLAERMRAEMEAQAGKETKRDESQA